MISLNKNILANFIGVAVTTLLTLIVVPFYLKNLGPAAYGLVGISTMIQGWIMLLNAGLAPVAGRQAAQAHIGAVDWASTARFFRTVDWFLIAISLPIIVLAFVLRYWLAEHWLGKNNLGADTIALSIVLLVIMTLIRLATNVSRGIIANVEAQIWLNLNLIFFNFLRFAVSIPLVAHWQSITTLFYWWVFVAIAEYVSVQLKIARLVPVNMPYFVFDFNELKKHGKMAATLALTSSIWVVITNLDKLLLSGILSLADYGYFNVATLLAGGVLSLTQPISQAFQPRLTKAFTQGGVDEACLELRRCTRWVILLIMPVGAVIFAMPESILYLWTRDHAVAANAAMILRGYVLGSTLIAVGSILYIYQVAIGNVRWHLRGNLMFALILFPTLPVVVKLYGAQGAAWLWAGFNLFLFIFWNAILLKKLARPLYPAWLVTDTLYPMLISFGLACAADYFYLRQIESTICLLASIVALSGFISIVLWFLSLNRELKR
ncbi:O-antigen/teichoic acid export membrane protein [Oxalobacteraceae bacterium GrIS 2.11]